MKIKTSEIKEMVKSALKEEISKQNSKKSVVTKASFGEDRDDIADALISGRNSLLEACDNFIDAYKELKTLSEADASTLKNNVIDLLLGAGEGDLTLTAEVDKLIQKLKFTDYTYNE